MKINIIDLLIGLFVVSLVGFGFMTLRSSGQLVYKEQTNDYTMKVLEKRVYKDVLDEIQVGDEIYDSQSNKYLGILTNKKVDKAFDEIEVNGKLVNADLEDYFNVIYTIEGEGVYHPEKGMKIADTIRFIGHPIYIKSKLYAGFCIVIGLEVDKTD